MFCCWNFVWKSVEDHSCCLRFVVGANYLTVFISRPKIMQNNKMNEYFSKDKEISETNKKCNELFRVIFKKFCF